MDSFRKIFKMGGSVGTLKRSSSARSSSCMSSSTGSSLMEMLKPSCLKSEKGVTKRPVTPEKLQKKTKQNVYSTTNSSTSSTKKDNVISGEGSFTSLGEWLSTSSPASKPDSINGGEIYVLRSPYSSRRVHPSSSASSSSIKLPRVHDAENYDSLGSKARDSFSKDRSNVTNEGRNINQDANLVNMGSTLSRNQSGDKSRKRVSFRLPVEADIIIFYPSEEFPIDWFAYSAAHGFIAEVNSKDEFDSCDTSNPIRMFKDGLDSTPMDKEGLRYFTSSNTESCKNGLKLHVQVVPHQDRPNTVMPAVATSEISALAAAKAPSTPSGSAPLSSGLVLLSVGFALLGCVMGL